MKAITNSYWQSPFRDFIIILDGVKRHHKDYLCQNLPNMRK